jgi:hypothetical protein
VDAMADELASGVLRLHTLRDGSPPVLLQLSCGNEVVTVQETCETVS